jgi:hypothetical protein
MAFTAVSTNSTILNVNDLVDQDIEPPPYPSKSIFVKPYGSNQADSQKAVSPTNSESSDQQNEFTSANNNRVFLFPPKITPKDFKPLPPLKQNYNFEEVANIVYSTSHCRTCGRREPENDYITLCGILWCIFTFPIGILCLIYCRQKKCSYCGTPMH